MLNTFLSTLEQMVRILIVIIFGYIMHKSRAVPKVAESVVSKLVTLLFAPALSFYSFATESQISSLVAFAPLVLIGLMFRLSSIGISYPLSKLFSPKDTYCQGVYRYAFSFPNSGAFATPLIFAFFGTSGLFQFSLFQFTATFLTYTWGSSQMEPEHEKIPMKQRLIKFINPNTVAMFSGMLLGILGAKNWMPNIVLTTFKDLSTCYVMGGLLVIGFTLADYPFKEIFSNWKVYIFSVLRLIVIPAVFLAVLLLFGAPEMLCIITVLAYAAPCGMGAVIFPSFYGMECEDGVQMVLISSLAAIITVPVMLALVQLFV